LLKEHYGLTLDEYINHYKLYLANEITQQQDGFSHYGMYFHADLFSDQGSYGAGDRSFKDETG
jgi:hypothetical protein